MRFATWTALLVFAAALPGWAAEGWVRESPGQRAEYGPDGELRRLQVDEDGDGRYEVVERYREGRRVERREDPDGDDRWERTFTWEADGSAVAVEDPGEGAIRRTFYDPAGAVRRVEEDADRDGSPESVWHYRDGALARVEKPGGVWEYEGGVVRRARIDDDRDGEPERLEIYEDGTLARMEERGPDGEVRGLWRYGPDGEPERAEEDLDGDGRREATRVFRPDGTVERVLDRDGDGTPELREEYDADGRLLSREEDLDGDGTFDVRERRAGE